VKSLPPLHAKDLAQNLARNLASVRARIRAAGERGRNAAASVDLVVVTKSASPAVFPALAAAGVTDVGENRVQAAEARRPGSPAGWRWHGIGHLQRNKAAKAVALFDVFHALDSVGLAERLAAVREGMDPPWPVYIQVNAAGDPAKGGFVPEETSDVVRRILRLPPLRPVGLMTMARLGAGEAEARAAFRTLRERRDDLVREGLGEEPIAGLSMGMSDDFEWAVEEGATVVRVGRAVFEGVGLPTPEGPGGPPAGEVA
jgi:pyridoxal phosphate enzyme (YggS family)